MKHIENEWSEFRYVLARSRALGLRDMIAKVLPPSPTSEIVSAAELGASCRTLAIDDLAADSSALT